MNKILFYYSRKNCTLKQYTIDWINTSLVLLNIWNKESVKEKENNHTHTIIREFKHGKSAFKQKDR